jgi:hypothetical protein
MHRAAVRPRNRWRLILIGAVTLYAIEFCNLRIHI